MSHYNVLIQNHFYQANLYIHWAKDIQYIIYLPPPLEEGFLFQTRFFFFNVENEISHLSTNPGTHWNTSPFAAPDMDITLGPNPNS